MRNPMLCGHRVAATMMGGAIGALAPMAALADGFYVPSGVTTGVALTGDQRAILTFNPEDTVLTLQTGYQGNESTFAWVIPTAQLLTAADVWVEEHDAFASWHERTEPKLVTMQEGCAVVGCATSDGDAQGTGTVTVLDTFTVDNYALTVLSASESNDLAAWLTSNDYRVPADANEVFANYTNRGFYFLAVRFEAPAALTTTQGDTDASATPENVAKPLSMRFTGQMLTFPLLISTLSTPGDIDLLLFTIGDHRYRIAGFPNVDVVVPKRYAGNDFSGWYRAQLEQVWTSVAGPVFAVEFADVLNTYDSETMYSQRRFVTRLHARIGPNEMTEDLTLEAVAPLEEAPRLRIRVLDTGPDRGATAALQWDVLLVAVVLVWNRKNRRSCVPWRHR